MSAMHAARTRAGSGRVLDERRDRLHTIAQEFIECLLTHTPRGSSERFKVPCSFLGRFVRQGMHDQSLPAVR